MVVAEQRPGAGDDLDRAAVVDGQRVRRGAGEQPVVVDEERRVGAGVAVDALVVVADAEHVERGQGEQAQQQHVGRREVLELVDEQVAARPLHRAAERPVGEQRLDGGVDLLVEVDGAALGELATVRREQLGEAGDVVARRLDVLGVASARGGSPSAPRRTGRSDRCSPGAGAGRAAATSTMRRTSRSSSTGGDAAAVLGEHPQAERVQRADAGPEVGGARLHLQLGLLVVGDGERRCPARTPRSTWRWRSRSVSTRVLPEPAGRDDPRRPGPVGDRGELVGGQVGARGDRRGTTAEAADVDRLAVHDGEPPTSRAPRAAAGRRRPTPAGRRAA